MSKPSSRLKLPRAERYSSRPMGPTTAATNSKSGERQAPPSLVPMPTSGLRISAARRRSSVFGMVNWGREVVSASSPSMNVPHAALVSGVALEAEFRAVVVGVGSGACVVVGVGVNPRAVTIQLITSRAIIVRLLNGRWASCGRLCRCRSLGTFFQGDCEA